MGGGGGEDPEEGALWRLGAAVERVLCIVAVGLVAGGGHPGEAMAVCESCLERVKAKVRPARESGQGGGVDEVGVRLLP